VYQPERLHPLVLDPTSPALHTLQRIRDEAHRFAITYHKKLRTKRTIQSVLDTIPGIGPSIRTSLLKTLGSARRRRDASVAELAAVPKVTPKLAQRIFDHFHPPEETPPPAEMEPDRATDCYNGRSQPGQGEVTAHEKAHGSHGSCGHAGLHGGRSIRK